MFIENLDFIPVEWLGDRMNNFIDNNLDAVAVAGASALAAFFKSCNTV